MPITLDDIDYYGLPMPFLKKGQLAVVTGPNTIQFIKSDKIPLDGRLYKCSGNIILNNGLSLHSNFNLTTDTFLCLENIWVFIESEKAWYRLDEKELLNILNISYNDIHPFKWQPDVPLDYLEPGPYPEMKLRISKNI